MFDHAEGELKIPRQLPLRDRKPHIASINVLSD